MITFNTFKDISTPKIIRKFISSTGPLFNDLFEPSIIVEGGTTQLLQSSYSLITGILNPGGRRDVNSETFSVLVPNT
ncbi:hypothetical protein H8356DRAFT_1329719 [Neocallimastix lanati (nom. inval.)]|nr:hypothetical protein H8356DRAFT_1329719 [Neocallimastix sp. JGI-2020a]